MKILEVLPTLDPRYGGPVAVVEGYVRQLEARGHLMRTWCVSSPGPLGRYAPGIRELRLLAASIEWADLAHIHGLWVATTALAGRLSRRFSTPFLVSPHGMLDEWCMDQRRFAKSVYWACCERSNLRGAVGFHCLSAHEAGRVRHLLPEARTWVVPNGIDCVDCSNPSIERAVVKQFPQLENVLRILYLGRLDRKKRIEVLFEAVRLTNASHSRVHLVVAGAVDSTYGLELRRLVQGDRVLNRSVSFAGFVSGAEKTALLCASDVFVLLSDQEGDSMAVKEALGAGLAAVLSKDCVAESVMGMAAIRVVSVCAQSVAEAFVDIAAESDSRLEMISQVTRREAADRFGWDKVGRLIETMYACATREYSNGSGRSLMDTEAATHGDGGIGL